MGTNHKSLELLLIIVALALLAPGAARASYDVLIETNVHAALGTTISVPVYGSTGPGSFYGFDLLIVYDTAALAYAGTVPGELFDIPGSYEWEYFESAEATGPEPGLIRAVGVADIDNDEHHPVAVHIPESLYSAVLFTLEFTVIADPSYEFTVNPIRFYWVDCGDNAVVPDSLGYTLALSDRVFDRDIWEVEITDYSFGLPGIHGAPDLCLTDPSISRGINFFNGGITILPADTSKIRGDINCNGIAYEIADFVQFTYYFVVGPSAAFGEHFVCSRVATDINGDGYELTVADLVYLYRVIIGDAVPYPAAEKGGSVIATFIRDSDAGTVSFDYPASLAAIYLEFDGEILPTLLFDVEGIILDYGYLDGHTRVLIAPEISSFKPVFTTTDGPFLSYTGSGLLMEADAADYDGTVFQVQIENYGSGLAVPFGLQIGVVQDAVQGAAISIPIVKTAGSEKMSGFDILIGYDYSALQISQASPGPLFDIPGDYEWEYFSYRFGPFECAQGCPSGMVRMVGVAETANGPHHPTESMVPDGTVLFNLDCQVAPDPELEGTFVPVSFFWLDCGDNGIAGGEYGDTLVLSRHVYDDDGFEITDTEYGLPGYYGTPDSCFEPVPNPAIRFADFTNGGVDVVQIESMELILSIDHVTAAPGDSDLYIDVRMSNPQDSVAGFMLSVNMDNPDLAEFGISSSDTISMDVQNTLISDWEFFSTQSQTGTFHDLKIVAISNSMPPFTAAIPPQQNGVLVRLLVHAHSGIPESVTDSTTQLVISDAVSSTHFSDPGGQLIGIIDAEYNPQTVSFQNGSITIRMGGCGDANGDGVINIGDAVFLVVYIFKVGPAPDPLLVGDANCDGTINIADAVYLIDFIFKDGPEPSCH